jgi:hypothetical protein
MAAKAHARAPTKRLEDSEGSQLKPKRESRARAEGGTQMARCFGALLEHA